MAFVFLDDIYARVTSLGEATRPATVVDAEQAMPDYERRKAWLARRGGSRLAV